MIRKDITLIQKHYSGSEAKLYEHNRKNKKWQFEKKVVENFIKSKQDISSIADAPLGTNRFGDLIDQQKNIKKFYGYEYSDDMIKFATSKSNKKLSVIKHDLINHCIKNSVDALLMIRMLNLVTAEDMEKILLNTLPKVQKYFVCTLRHDSKYQYIENKIHIQELEKFNNILNKFGFIEIQKHNLNEPRKGNYTIIVASKNENI